jgi:uncharacterized protein (TIGR02444 family)
LDLRTAISTHKFWQYSLQFYTQNNNQTTLLWLQDNAALNVNVALLLMYLQTKGVFISGDQFNHLNQENQDLDSLTSSFREKRRVLKADNIEEGMADYRTLDYQALFQQELDCEKQQQAQLIDIVSTFGKHTHDGTSMDIKYYLLTLVTSIESTLITKVESHIDVLIEEQQKLANNFAHH